MDMEPRSLPTYRYTSMRCYIANSYIGKLVLLRLGQTTYNITLYTHSNYERLRTSTGKLCTHCVCGLAAELNAGVKNEPEVTLHLYKRGVRSAKCFFLHINSTHSRQTAKSDCCLRHAWLSFCLSTWNNSASIGRIFMKFDIWGFLWNLSKFKFY